MGGRCLHARPGCVQQLQCSAAQTCGQRAAWLFSASANKGDKGKGIYGLGEWNCGGNVEM